MKTAEQCYGDLGLQEGASDEEVKSSYRELVKKYHPDKNETPEAKEKFIQIQQAYESIINKKFASPYNRSGGFDFGGFGFPGFQDFTPFVGRSFEQPSNFNKVFSLSISFLESCLGCTKTIEYAHQVKCSGCEEYAKQHGRPNILSCKICGGSGSFQRDMGPVRITQPCQSCAGKGITLSCDVCNGVGSLPKKTQVSFKINPGVNNDATLKLNGRADFDYKSNSYGDVFIKIQVIPHPTMTRNGMDIFSKIKVPYLDCILGAEVEFESIHGIDKIKIPPLTEAGGVIKKTETGINKLGSHILTIEVELPKELNDVEKRLLNKIKNSKSKK